MRNKIIIVLSFTVLVVCTGWAQSSRQDAVLNSLEEAIRVGDSKKLMPLFSPFINVGVNGKEKTYSNVQAEQVCHNFFRQYPCSAFAVVHTSRSKKDLQYTIGQYKSDSTNYNVLIKTRRINGQHLIYEISFIVE